jgi:hypothetical protein
MTASVLPVPQVRWAGVPGVRGDVLELEFNIESPRPGLAIQLWRAAKIGGVWTHDTAATLETVEAGALFRFLTRRGDAPCGFFQVRLD